MPDPIVINGKKFITSKQAAALTGYARDYIGQLVRMGKVKGQVIDKVLFVSEDSLLAHADIKNDNTKVVENSFKNALTAKTVDTSSLVAKASPESAALFPNLNKSVVAKKAYLISKNKKLVSKFKKSSVPTFVAGIAPYADAIGKVTSYTLKHAIGVVAVLTLLSTSYASINNPDVFLHNLNSAFSQKKVETKNEASVLSSISATAKNLNQKINNFFGIGSKTPETTVVLLPSKVVTATSTIIREFATTTVVRYVQGGSSVPTVVNNIQNSTKVDALAKELESLKSFQNGQVDKIYESVGNSVSNINIPALSPIDELEVTSTFTLNGDAITDLVGDGLELTNGVLTATAGSGFSTTSSDYYLSTKTSLPNLTTLQGLTNLTTVNATTTTFALGSDYITDLTGSGLTIVNNALTTVFSTSSANYNFVANLAATSSLPNINTLAGLANIGSSTGTTTFYGNVSIGTSTVTSKLTLAGGNFTHTASGNPVLIGSYNTSGEANGVYVSGKYTYVADGTAGLRIINTNNPESPVLVGTYSTVGDAADVRVSGKFAYVAARGGGLQIVDISNPTNPTLMSRTEVSSATDVYVSGKYAYVTLSGNPSTGLAIVDVSDPYAPVVVGQYNTIDDALGIYIFGKYAYLAEHNSGIEIVDISNPAEPTLIGTYNTPGAVYSISVSGKYAYIADLDSLQIIDISNPTSPSFVGSINAGLANSFDVSVSGKYAYVTDSSSGLKVIDISNPTAPTLVGTMSAGSGATDVFVSGKYAYVANYTNGLAIFDINGIETPALYAGNINTNALTVTENVDIGNNLYIRNGLNVGQGGIFTDGVITAAGTSSSYFGGNVGIGTTSPYAKLSVAGQVVGQYFTATSTTATSTFPLFSTSAFGLGSDYVTDITGSNLSIVNGALTVTLDGSFSTTSVNYWESTQTRWATTSDSYAFDTRLTATTTLNNLTKIGTQANLSFGSAVGSALTLSSLDCTIYSNGGKLTTDANGVVSCANDTSGSGGGGSGSDTNWTYFNDSGVSLATTTNQVVIGASATSSSQKLQVTGGMYLIGTLGIGTSSPYETLSVNGGAVFNNAVRASFFIATSTTATSTLPNLAITNLLFGSDYVTDLTGTGLSIVNGALTVDSSGNWATSSANYNFVANLAATTSLAKLNSLSGLANIGSSTGTTTFYGNVSIGTSTATSKLTLAGGNFRHTASNLGNPIQFYPGGGVSDVYVSGKYAYTAALGAGLKIIDISIPETPAVVGTYDTSGNADSVFVSGKYAYVADEAAGLQIIDISRANNPILVGTYNTPGFAVGVYVSGKYAYLADYNSGLQIIDISNPANPTLASNYDTTGTAVNVYVSGKYAYVADSASGLQIIDISNPTSPVLVGTYDSPISVTGVYVAGKFAYVADQSGGLRVVNVSNPASPSLVGTNATVFADKVFVAGKYAYVTNNGYYQVHILDISSTTNPVLVDTKDIISTPGGLFVSGKYLYVSDTAAGLYIIDINGIETPSLYAGNINTNGLTVTENVDVGNNLYVRSGLNVGANGIFTDGALTVAGTSSASYFGGIVGIGSTTPWATFAVNPVAGQASNQFVVGSSTGTSFIIKNNGFVGIGTTSPVNELTVANSGGVGSVSLGNVLNNAAYGGITLNGSPAGNNYNFLSSPTDTNLYINRPSGKSIVFREANSTGAASSNIVTITTGALFGIGTSTPLAKLDIFNTTSSATAPLFSVASSTSGAGTSTAFIVTANGNVGMGTSTPSGQLTVSGSGGSALPTTNVFQQLEINGGGSNSTQRLSIGVLSSAIGQTAAGTGIIQAITNGSTFNNLLLNPRGGNVGIGTTSPYSPLSVNGTTTALLFQATSTTATSSLPLLAVTALSVNGIYTNSLWSTTSDAFSFSALLSATSSVSKLVTLAGLTNIGSSSATTNVLGNLKVTGTAALNGASIAANTGLMVQGAADSGSSAYAVRGNAAGSNTTFAILGYDNTTACDNICNVAGLYAETNTSGGRAIVGSASGSGVAGYFVSATGNALEAFSTDGYGLSVGSTNSQGLHVSGSTYSIYAVGGPNYFENNVGVGTTSPYAKLSVVGQVVGEYFTATSTTATSTFPLLSTNAISINGGYFTSLWSTTTDSLAFDARLAATTTLNNLTTLRGLTTIGSITGTTTILGDLKLNSIPLVNSVGESLFIGTSAGSSATGATDSYFFGNLAGAGATNASASNFLGYGAGYIASAASNSNFLGYNAGGSATNAAGSNFFGTNAGNTATNASYSNFLGLVAGQNATNASYSNFLGGSAGRFATNASYSTFIGNSAGESATAANNSNFLGNAAGQNATNANNSNFSGVFAGYNATNARYSNFFGAYSGREATQASSSNFFGNSSGYYSTNAGFSNFFGENAGYFAPNAANSIFIGRKAGNSDTVNNTTGNKSSILLGNYTSTGGFSNSIAIGQGVMNSAVDQLNIGRVLYATGIGSSTTPTATAISGGKIGIGTTTPSSALHIEGTNDVTGGLTISSTAGTANKRLAIYPAGSFTTDFQKLVSGAAIRFINSAGTSELIIDSSGNIGIGTTTPQAKLSIIGGNLEIGTSSSATVGNITIGGARLLNTYTPDIPTGLSSNIFVGKNSGNYTMTGTNGQNSSLGAEALTGLTSGVANSFVGFRSGLGITSGSSNAGIGGSACRNITTGSTNTCLGASSGYFGNNSGAQIATVSYTTNIGFGAYSSRSNSMVLGGLASDYTDVVIGTSTPFARLGIQSFYGSTTPLFDIASTTSSLFATTSLFRVTSDGNIGIGTATPGALLDVQGAAQFGSGNVNLIDSTGKIAGISSTYFASLDGSNLTSLNATQLTSGTVPSARMSGTSGAYSIDPLMAATNQQHTTLGSATIGELALSDAYSQNKMQFVPPITIEYTTNGVDWYEHPTATTSTAVKNMFLGYNANAGITILGPNNGNWTAVRMTWLAPSYSYLNDFYLYNSTNGHTVGAKIEKSYGSDINTWDTVASTTAWSSWPGHTMIPHTTIAWNPNPTPGTHSKYVRITFTPSWNGTYPNNNINLTAIDWFGQYPANNNPMQLYTWDFDKNVTFTGGVNSTLSTATSTIAGGMRVAGTTGLNVLQNGNIGIGTASPQSKLEINAASDTAGQGLRFTGWGAIRNPATGSGALAFDYYTGSSWSQGAVLNTAGRFGIGTTTPGAKLDIFNTASSATAPLFSVASSTSGAGTSTAFYIAANGNVGIGTSTVNSKLTLAGGNFTHTAVGNPTLLTTYDTPGLATGLYVSGKYSYVADGTSGLQIFDISNPASSTLVGTYNTSDVAYDVYVSGKYAYVADQASGLQIIDISNPTSPVLTGTYNTSGSAYGVYVSGKYAYVADFNSGLQIIDISNPVKPLLTGTYNTDSFAYSVFVSGKYAYVGDDSYMDIIDISNPAAPSRVSHLVSSTSFIDDVYVSGKYAYAAEGLDGLSIIDISNPSSPVRMGSYNTTGYANNVFVSGKYAYVADSSGGLQVIDISSSTVPRLVGTYDTTGNAYGIFVSGKYAYVADNASGFEVFDINGIETPSLYAGNINTNALTVTENADIANSLYVRNGINVGEGGIFTDGIFTAAGTSSSSFGGSLGIGTSSAVARLDVFNSLGGTAPLFSVASSTSGAGTSTALVITANGLVGVGSSTPWRTLSLTGTAAFSGLTTAAGTPNSLCINAVTKEITENAATSCVVSDRDQKQQIQELSVSGLDAIRKIQPVTFAYNDRPDRNRIGFIAQDLQAVDDRLGDAFDKNHIARSIDIPAIMSITVKAVKELDTKVTEQASTTENKFLSVIGAKPDSADNFLINGDLTFKNKFTIKSSGPDAPTEYLTIDSSNGSNLITFAGNGNIGIGTGTTTSAYKLQVQGDVAATAFVNISTLESKTDVTYLTDDKKQDILTTLNSMKIAQYHYKTEDAKNPLRLGLIAEEAPSEVLSVGGKGVDIYKLSTFAIAAIQAQQKQIQTIDARLTLLEAKVASSSPATVSKDELTASVLSGLKELFAVDKLTVGSKEKPTGITLFDEKTGLPYCLKIQNGNMSTAFGECGAVIETSVEVTLPPAQGINEPTTSTTTATTTIEIIPEPVASSTPIVEEIATTTPNN